MSEPAAPMVEYQQVEGSAFDTLKATIEELGQCKLNIMFIERVISKLQEDRFNACDLSNERLVFHGTNPDSGNSIEATGLSISHSMRAAYGKGNYFSPNPLVSLSYAPRKYDYHCIYLCKVKFGQYKVNYNTDGSEIFCAYADEQSNTIYRIGLFPTGHTSTFDHKKANLPTQ